MNNTKVKIKKVKSTQYSKGITLIALIITIIILIILAGVTLNVLTGENGIINRAVKAKEDTENKSAEELLKIAVMSSMNIEEGSSKISIDKLNKNIKEINGIDENTVITELPAIVKINNKKYIVTEIGEVLDNKLLPDEYVRLGYIESTGKQFIDLGLAPKKDLIIESKINPQEKSGNIYIGVMGADDKTDYRFFYTQGNLYFDINAGRAQVLAAESEILNNIFTVELGNYYIKKDGETVISRTPTDSEPDISKNLCIFGGYFGTSMAYSKLRAYTLKIWDEGKLVRDMIPCKNAEGIAGLYDLVENKFYSSKTETEFIAGNEI